MRKGIGKRKTKNLFSGVKPKALPGGLPKKARQQYRTQKGKRFPKRKPFAADVENMLWYLGIKLGKNEKPVQKAMELLVKKEKQPGTKLALIMALGRTNPNRRLVKLVKRLVLEERFFGTERVCIMNLARWEGKMAVPFFLDLLRHENPNVKSAAIMGINKLGSIKQKRRAVAILEKEGETGFIGAVRLQKKLDTKV